MNFMKVAQRTVVQVAFTPTLSFVENMIAMAKDYQLLYRNWIYNSSKQTILLYDDDSKKRFTINPRQIELVMENSTAEQVRMEVEKIWTIFFEDTDILEFGGVGSIVLSLDKTSTDYSDYAEMFFAKYYTYAASVGSRLNDQVTDVIQVIEGVKDGCDTRIKFAPLKEGQIEEFYPNENYAQSVAGSLKNSTPIFSEAAASIISPSSKEEVVNRIEKVVNLTYELHRDIRDLSIFKGSR